MNDRYFIPIIAASGVLFLVFLFFIIFYILYHTKRVRMHAEEKQRLEFELMSSRLEEHERSMNQISRELHDNISQKMDFLQMNIKALREGRTESQRAIENSASLAEQISADLRNISYSLNSDYVKVHGLAAVLRQELDYIRSTTTTHCNFDATGYKSRLPAEKELLIYRIAQEALHNSVKHAKATEISLSIANEAGKFTMLISDNGKGFDPIAPTSKKGLGLSNMHSRAKLLGGNLEVISAPAKGTIIRLGL